VRFVCGDPVVQNRRVTAPEELGPPPLPEEAAELFAADPDRFVAERDALAKKLHGSGAPEKARLIKRLRKPTLAVWATNQAARHRPDLAKQLLDAGQTMASARSSAQLRKASAERQTAIRSLVNEAVERLEQGGHSAAGSVADKITQMLLALSSDDLAGSAFAKGMLERELDPELDFGFAVSAAGQDDDAEASSAIKDARSKAEERERRASELKAEVAELERQARSAQDRLELARMEAERAAKQLDSARRRLANAQTQSEDARTALVQLEEGP
jgi:hypothetical protein